MRNKTHPTRVGGFQSTSPRPTNIRRDPRRRHSPSYYERHRASRQARMKSDRIKEMYANDLGPPGLYPNTDIAPWDYNNWKAIKVLGHGGNGIASLWEYRGPDIIPQTGATNEDTERISSNSTIDLRGGKGADVPDFEIGAKIVLKTPLRSNAVYLAALQREANAMLKLGMRGDPHLVRALMHREPGMLYLEYVEGGDLWQELGRRRGKELDETRARKQLYAELELWRMFGCLARGMETMGLCAGGEEMGGAKGTMWWPWLHLDFKPDNIFLGRGDDHDCKGNDIQYKIADFGWAQELEGYHEGWKLPDAARRAFRGAGNIRWRTPEQMTEDWSASQWQRSEIAGNWTPQLNMFSVGLVMWQMAVMTFFPCSAQGKKDRYISILDTKLVRGYTFGRELESTGYSTALKVLILQCMMEKPKFRPTPRELVAAIEEHLRDSVDGWEGYKLSGWRAVGDMESGVEVQESEPSEKSVKTIDLRRKSLKRPAVGRAPKRSPTEELAFKIPESDQPRDTPGPTIPTLIGGVLRQGLRKWLPRRLQGTRSVLTGGESRGAGRVRRGAGVGVVGEGVGRATWAADVVDAAGPAQLRGAGGARRGISRATDLPRRTAREAQAEATVPGAQAIRSPPIDNRSWSQLSPSQRPAFYQPPNGMLQTSRDKEDAELAEQIAEAIQTGDIALQRQLEGKAAQRQESRTRYDKIKEFEESIQRTAREITVTTEGEAGTETSRQGHIERLEELRRRRELEIAGEKLKIEALRDSNLDDVPNFQLDGPSSPRAPVRTRRPARSPPIRLRPRNRPVMARPNFGPRSQNRSATLIQQEHNDAEQARKEEEARLLLPYVMRTNRFAGRTNVYYFNTETGRNIWKPPLPEQTYAGGKSRPEDQNQPQGQPQPQPQPQNDPPPQSPPAPPVPPARPLPLSPLPRTTIAGPKASPVVSYPWRKIRAKTTGEVYYYNSIKGTTQIEPPSSSESTASSGVASGSGQAWVARPYQGNMEELPFPWIKRTMNDGGGMDYFHNPETGAIQFERPG